LAGAAAERVVALQVDRGEPVATAAALPDDDRRAVRIDRDRGLLLARGRERARARLAAHVRRIAHDGLVDAMERASGLLCGGRDRGARGETEDQETVDPATAKRASVCHGDECRAGRAGGNVLPGRPRSTNRRHGGRGSADLCVTSPRPTTLTEWRTPVSAPERARTTCAHGG